MSDAPNPTDQFIPVKDLPEGMEPVLSRIVSVGAKARVKDCLLEVTSINDAKNTVTFRLAGVFPRLVVNNGN